MHRALLLKGYESSLIDMTDRLLAKGSLAEFIGPTRPDVAFLAVHGTHAEDGAIQGLLELLDIPYTGSSLQSSAICMDKQLTKLILQQHGVLTPRWQFVEDVGQLKLLGFKFPLMVKPNFEGSSKGITQESVVEDPAQIKDVVARALARESPAKI